MHSFNQSIIESGQTIQMIGGGGGQKDILCSHISIAPLSTLLIIMS